MAEPKPELDLLSRHVGKLENRVRRLELSVRCLLAILVLAPLAVFAAAAKKPTPAIEADAVVAGRFEMKDEQGQLRASLSVGKVGPSLRLFDAAGQERARVSVREAEGPVISLNYRDGTPGMAAILGENGPAITCADEHGKPISLQMGMSSQTGAPFLQFLDASGKVIGGWTSPKK